MWVGLALVLGEVLGLVKSVIVLAVIVGLIVIIMTITFLACGSPGKKEWPSRFVLILPVVMLAGYINFTMAAVSMGLESVPIDRVKVSVLGEIDKLEEKSNSIYVYLKEARLDIEIAGRMTDTYYLLLIIKKDEYYTNLQPGDMINAEGTLEEFAKPANPGQFNEFSYYKSLGLHYKFYSDTLTVTYSNTNLYKKCLYMIKNHLKNNYLSLLDEQKAGIIIGMVLGDKQLITDEINDLYKNSGIAHILAISGLHVSFLGMGFYNCLRKMRVHTYLATGLGLFMVISYTIMTGFAMSTFRAAIMLFISFGGRLAGRTYDALTSAAAANILMLAVKPLLIYHSGVWLSFTAVLSLYILLPLLEKVLPKLAAFRMLNPGLSVTIGTLPVIAWCYFEFPLYSVLLNYIVILFMGLLFPLAFAAGIAAGLWWDLGIFLAGGISWILEIYETACQFFLNLPGARQIVGKPSLMQIMIYFILIFTGLILSRRLKKRFLIISMAGLLILCCRKPLSELMVTFIDVGQGDSIFIQVPGDINILVDGGSTSINGVGEYRLIPFLKSLGISKLDYIAVTHTDGDHISGIIEIIKEPEGISIENLILPDTELIDESYLELEELAKSKGIDVHYMKRGDKMAVGDIVLKCLHPVQEFLPDSKNAYSLVMDIAYHNFDMLLTGDIERNGEQVLMSSGLLRQYDILKVAHHGSKNSTGEDFLNSVKPVLSVISCGKDNRYGHPHEELIGRLSEINSEILTTAVSGAITVITDGYRINVLEFSR